MQKASTDNSTTFVRVGNDLAQKGLENLQDVVAEHQVKLERWSVERNKNNDKILPYAQPVRSSGIMANHQGQSSRCPLPWECIGNSWYGWYFEMTPQSLGSGLTNICWRLTAELEQRPRGGKENWCSSCGETVSRQLAFRGNKTQTDQRTAKELYIAPVIGLQPMMVEELQYWAGRSTATGKRNI